MNGHELGCDAVCDGIVSGLIGVDGIAMELSVPVDFGSVIDVMPAELGACGAIALVECCKQWVHVKDAFDTETAHNWLFFAQLGHGKQAYSDLMAGRSYEFPSDVFDSFQCLHGLIW